MSQLLEQYLHTRLAELEKGKLEKDAVMKGQLSFGMAQDRFGHLPAWASLVRQKKIFKTNFWGGAVFVSAMMVFVFSNVWEKMEVNFLKGLLLWISLSATALFFYIIMYFYNIYYSQHKVELEARKLIYQDILQRLQNEAAVSKKEAA